MGDDNKIKIGFEVEGADQAVDAVKKVEDAVEGAGKSSASNPMAMPKEMLGPDRAAMEQDAATKKRIHNQIQADVDALIKKYDTAADKIGKDLDDVNASLEKMGKTSEATGEKVDKVIGIERAGQAAKLGKDLGKLADYLHSYAKNQEELKDKSAEAWKGVADGVGMASNAMSLGAKGFAVAGPMGAAIGGLIGVALVPLKNAFENMTKAQKSATDGMKEAEEWSKKLKTAEKERADEVRKSDITRFYKDQTEALREQTVVLERQKAVREAAQKAQTAKENVADDELIRQGGDATKVHFNSALRRSTEDTDKLTDEIDDAQKKKDIASENLSLARFKQEEIGNTPGGELTPEYKAATTAVESARSFLNEATEALVTLEKTRSENIKEVTSNLEGDKNKAIGELREKAKENATELLEKSEEILKEGKAQYPALLSQAVGNIKEILKDGIVREDEMQGLIQATQQVRGAIDAKDQVTLKFCGDLAATVISMKTEMAEMNKFFNAQVEAIKATR